MRLEPNPGLEVLRPTEVMGLRVGAGLGTKCQPEWETAIAEARCIVVLRNEENSRRLEGIGFVLGTDDELVIDHVCVLRDQGEKAKQADLELLGTAMMTFAKEAGAKTVSFTCEVSPLELVSETKDRKWAEKQSKQAGFKPDGTGRWVKQL